MDTNSRLAKELILNLQSNLPHSPERAAHVLAMIEVSEKELAGIDHPGANDAIITTAEFLQSKGI